jgi:serine/threonine-protein kinase
VAGVRRVPSSQPQGTVVAQSPQAAQRARKGTKVQINVSQGRASTTTTVTTTTVGTPANPVPAQVQIPDVVGLTLAQARTSLAKTGLKADPKFVPSTQDKNTVVAQYPAAGAPAKHGGSVRVNVSQGPGTKAVPDVTGEDETTATTKLQNAGFDVKVVRQDTTDPTEDGVVLDQTPEGGADAKPGAKITITVGNLTSG